MRADRAAIVFDIDETSLSNYAELNAADFDSNALVTAVIEADSPAIQPTLNLLRFAVDRDVSAFFITGRPPAYSRSPSRTCGRRDTIAGAGWR